MKGGETQLAAPQPLRVSLVITNFNGERYLPLLRDAVRALRFSFHEILVSDDASTDASRLYLRHAWPEARVLVNDTNSGACVARNRGLHAASGEVVLLLDNDALPQPGSIEPMLAVLRTDPTVVAVTPRVVLHGTPPMVHCDGSSVHFTGQMALANGHVPLSTAPHQPPPVSSVMGTAMLFRREAALRVGGFEERFFIYYEDVDFGVRLRLHHGTVRAVTESHILHLGGTQNLSFRTGASYPPRRAFLIARNRQRFTLRTLSTRSLWILAPLLLLHEAMQALYSLAAGRLGLFTEATLANARTLGLLLRERENIQRERQVRDSEILSDGPLPLHPGTVSNPGMRALVAGFSRLLQSGYAALRPHLR